MWLGSTHTSVIRTDFNPASARHQMPAAPRYVLRPGLVYTHHLAHRDGTREKSQWQISMLQERRCFVHGLRCRWGTATTTWGLHVRGGRVLQLGIGRDHCSPAYIAKFVCDQGIQEWHGYPVDPKRKGDKPTPEVLRAWLDEGVLGEAKIRKIKGGQPWKP